jgi:FkbH-like protein
MLSFQTLKKNLKKNPTGLKTVELAILADTSSQLYVQALKGYAIAEGLSFEVFESDYNQIDMQVFDMGSELYSLNPEYIILFLSSQKLKKKFYLLSQTERREFADKQLAYFEKLVSTISQNFSSKIIFFNFSESDDAIFGNYANKLESSFIYQLRKINFELMNLAQKNKNLFINDLCYLTNRYGQKYILAEKIYINTDIIFSLDFLPIIAKNTVSIIQSLQGKINKCLILDLDNTVWGGIIGDDGIENIQIGDLGIGKAFTELQSWVKQLKERGIIICICSKNTESIAKEPFEKHPDMLIRLEDISIFIANWETKVDNIRYIQSVLNIGFDSMVFIDDNPFERNIIRENIPDITVPELPEDPSEYVSFLAELNLFETSSFTEEDAQRTRLYQEEAKRSIIEKSFANESGFLKSLEMISEIKPFNNFNIPRISQLSQRSNQFNLRTVRFTEEEIAKISESNNYITLSFNLKDKYGDYGLVAVIILEKQTNETLFINTWFMSCRVLKRGMENFTLNTIVRIAKENQFKYLAGEYIPTPKNSIVKDHYKELGFTQNSYFWKLDIENYLMKECFITSKS